MGWGACSDATTAADKVVCFSNSASFLKVLAPGVFINAAGITMSGTSQATPHVAGAIAVLRSLYPLETVTQIEQRLVTKGTLVTDTRNNVTKPRIDIMSALGNPCDLTLSPTSLTIGPAGGTYSVSVGTGSGCSWTVSNQVDWLSVGETASGTGPGSFVVQASILSDGTRSAVVSLTGSGAGANVNVKQTADATAPAGTVSINSNALYTRSTSVTLSLTASDESGVDAMCLSQSSTCSAWGPFQATKSFNLANTQGVQTVNVWYRDILGNTTQAPVSDQITLDSLAPTMGSLTGTSTSTSVTVKWTSANDATSGIASYKLVYRRGTTLPSAGCTNGTIVPVTTSFQATVSGLSRRTTYSFRLCAVDGAGNTSSGATLRISTTR